MWLGRRGEAFGWWSSERCDPNGLYNKYSEDIKCVCLHSGSAWTMPANGPEMSKQGVEGDVSRRVCGGQAADLFLLPFFYLH